jgi:hypothetical protein
MNNLNYQKRKNLELFSSFEKKLNLCDSQNYLPIYDIFFTLNNTNYNHINLNHKFYVSEIIDQNEDNSYNAVIKNTENDCEKQKTNIFIKFAPLLDPFKYFIGKYNVQNKNLFNLPKKNKGKEDFHSKILEKNNSSYVDGFFYFLSSKLLNEYDFINGINFYGSFLSIKKDFSVNINDDIEYMVKSNFFLKNKNVLFKVDDYSKLIDEEEFVSKTLKEIKIHHDINCDNFLNIEHLDSNSADDKSKIFNLKDIEDITSFIEVPKLENTKSVSSIVSNSTCSSRTSHTNEDDETDDSETDDDETNDDETENKNNDEVDDDENENEDEEDEHDEEEDEEELYAVIPKFPVEVICLEKCENTLDNLLETEEIGLNEFQSIFMQIIMTLITYQKAFSFTHNDLHTNNIMYLKTDLTYIYYCYKNVYYEVPTFGKIFKIIDFNRSIYKFNNHIFCSDSFQTTGDAATQYNTEPFFNKRKPRLDPNFSFDICRLACSIFDYLIDDMDEIKDLDKCSPIVKLIVEWTSDDKGVNILYKNNGMERYPDFKMYKMISRLVHNHTPQNQLEKNDFKQFIVNKNTLSKKIKVVNIDNIPQFFGKNA